MTSEDIAAIEERLQYRDVNEANMQAFVDCAPGDIEALIAEVRRLNSYGNALQVKRERDAAVADLRELSIFNRVQCKHCQHDDTGAYDEPCRDCASENGAFPSWEWRGVREAAE